MLYSARGFGQIPFAGGTPGASRTSHGLDGTRLATANAHPGVNNNLLNPVDVIDVPSNTHVVNGVPCRVRAI